MAGPAASLARSSDSEILRFSSSYISMSVMIDCGVRCLIGASAAALAAMARRAGRSSRVRRWFRARSQTARVMARTFAARDWPLAAGLSTALGSLVRLASGLALRVVPSYRSQSDRSLKSSESARLWMVRNVLRSDAGCTPRVAAARLRSSDAAARLKLRAKTRAPSARAGIICSERRVELLPVFRSPGVREPKFSERPGGIRLSLG